MRDNTKRYTNVCWPDRTYWGGKFVTTKECLEAKTHTVEIWGSSTDGWCVYLVSGDAGIQVSPIFSREQGDTMRDLKQACMRAYGVDPKRGRNWL
jgi:hypothetical protein